MTQELVLKKLVKSLLYVDIYSNSRQRDIVDARKIYAAILFQKGLGVSKIGKIMHKNHATVIHYIKEHDILILMDKRYMRNYRKILSAFDNEILSTDFNLLNKEELIFEIDKMKEEYDQLQDKYFKLLRKTQDNDTFNITG